MTRGFLSSCPLLTSQPSISRPFFPYMSQMALVCGSLSTESKKTKHFQRPQRLRQNSNTINCSRNTDTCAHKLTRIRKLNFQDDANQACTSQGGEANPAFCQGLLVQNNLVYQCLRGCLIPQDYWLIQTTLPTWNGIALRSFVRGFFFTLLPKTTCQDMETFYCKVCGYTTQLQPHVTGMIFFTIFECVLNDKTVKAAIRESCSWKTEKCISKHQHFQTRFSGSESRGVRSPFSITIHSGISTSFALLPLSRLLPTHPRP